MKQNKNINIKHVNHLVTYPIIQQLKLKKHTNWQHDLKPINAAWPWNFLNSIRIIYPTSYLELPLYDVLHSILVKWFLCNDNRMKNRYWQCILKCSWFTGKKNMLMKTITDLNRICHYHISAMNKGSKTLYHTNILLYLKKTKRYYKDIFPIFQ